MSVLSAWLSEFWAWIGGVATIVVVGAVWTGYNQYRLRRSVERIEVLLDKNSKRKVYKRVK